MAGLTDAKIKLDQLYDRVLENLQDCTPDLKRQLIEALDIKVYASTDKVEIQGVIPLELPTIGQTSGCLIAWHLLRLLSTNTLASSCPLLR